MSAFHPNGHSPSTSAGAALQSPTAFWGADMKFFSLLATSTLALSSPLLAADSATDTPAANAGADSATDAVAATAGADSATAIAAASAGADSATAAAAAAADTAQEPDVIDTSAPETINLSIEEAVERGLENNFRVQRSSRNEQMAETRVNQARAGLRPKFDVTASANQNQSYYNFEGNSYQYNISQPAFLANTYATASFPFDISGVERRRIQQARLSHSSSELDEAQATIDVATDIRSNYTTSLRAQEQVKADEQYLELTSRLLEQARSSQPSVVEFLKTEKANALQQLESSKTSRDLSLSGLRQQLRLDRNARLNLTTVLPSPAQLPSADKLLQIASKNRNDLKQADIRLQQAKLATRQASDSRRPRLNASAYGSQALNGETPLFNGDHGKIRSYGALLGLAVPLFQYDGGVLREQKRVAAIQAEQAVADKQESLERAENEIDQVMVGINRAKQRLSSLPDAGQARSALAQVEGQLLAAAPKDAPGLLAQVTNARQSLRQAEVSRNDAMTDFYTNYFRLQRAVGTEELGGNLDMASVSQGR